MNRLLIKGVAVLGVVALLLSVSAAWFAVPIGFTAGQHPRRVVTAEPWSTPYYKIAAVCIAAYSVAAWGAHGGWRRTLPCVLAIWFAVLLLFPWTVMLLDEETAGRAADLQTQHENLTWLGGDLSTAQEQAALNWKNRLFIVDPPTRVALATPPTWKPSQIGLDDLSALFDWLGYTNTFCQFVQRCWMLSLLGTACLLATSCFARGRFVVARMRSAVLVCASCSFLAFLAAWGVQFAAGREICRAATCSREGNYFEALRHLDRAASISPTLRVDTDCVVQRGLLEHLAGSKTPRSALVRASLLEREGRYAQADEVYQRLLGAEDPGAWPVRREACRGLLRSAIYALNAADNEQGVRQLEQILNIDPCHLKANYVLQLVYLRRGERQAMIELVDRLHATYACFQFPNKKVVLAAGQQNAFYAAYQQGDMHDAWQRSITSRRP